MSWKQVPVSVKKKVFTGLHKKTRFSVILMLEPHLAAVTNVFYSSPGKNTGQLFFTKLVCTHSLLGYHPNCHKLILHRRLDFDQTIAAPDWNWYKFSNSDSTIDQIPNRFSLALLGESPPSLNSIPMALHSCKKVMYCTYYTEDFS